MKYKKYEYQIGGGWVYINSKGIVASSMIPNVIPTKKAPTLEMFKDLKFIKETDIHEETEWEKENEVKYQKR